LFVFQALNIHGLQQEVSDVRRHGNHGFSFSKAYQAACSHTDQC